MATKTGKKTGGRKKGTPNKDNALLNAMVNYLIEDGYSRFKLELDKLDGESFIKTFISLCKSVEPKTNRTETIANTKLVEIFNEKIKNNGINK